MIRKFVMKAVIFSLPLLILASIPIPIGIYLGDLLTVSQILDLQQQNDGFYRTGGTQSSIIEYKLQVALQNPADFLVFGSSRFQYINSAIITNSDYQFYNASVLGQSPQNMLNMLEILAEKNAMPQILYMNIDLNHLNADCTEDFCLSDIEIASSHITRERQRLIAAYNDLSLDLLLAPGAVQADLNRVRDSESIYLIGRGRVSYHIDGSRFPNFSASRVENGFAGHEDDWSNQVDIYLPGSDVREETLDIYAQILAIANTHDTRVIAILPPYHPDFYVRLQSSPDHLYFELARQEILALFDENDAILLDYSNPADINIEPDFFFDSWHLGEVGLLQLYLEVLNQYPELLLSYSNPDTLNELLENAPDSFNLNLTDFP